MAFPLFLIVGGGRTCIAKICPAVPSSRQSVSIEYVDHKIFLVNVSMFTRPPESTVTTFMSFSFRNLTVEIGEGWTSLIVFNIIPLMTSQRTNTPDVYPAISTSPLPLTSIEVTDPFRGPSAEGSARLLSWCLRTSKRSNTRMAPFCVPMAINFEFTDKAVGSPTLSFFPSVISHSLKLRLGIALFSNTPEKLNLGPLAEFDACAILWSSLNLFFWSLFFLCMIVPNSILGLRRRFTIKGDRISRCPGRSSFFS
mmetsp:Transcript_3393/g.5056  ORF Transcript_3393/g.5056 Transcript_3393/m.5056 type:complete len:254 (+) Transcript_3393:2219-2980(+)